MSFFISDQKAQVGEFVSARNRARQFDFLEMSFVVSRTAEGQGLEIDHEFICTLNAYAARYLSLQPGRYRREYNVSVGDHKPSDWSIVLSEMEDFIDELHKGWANWTPTEAAAYALWGVNHVHPFCEGNGRTARALCYYVLCQKFGFWLPGNNTVLEQIRSQHRQQYCEILQRMHDARARPDMKTNLAEMADFIEQLVIAQIQSYQQQLAVEAEAPHGAQPAPAADSN